VFLNLAPTPEKCRHCTLGNAKKYRFQQQHEIAFILSPVKNCPLQLACELKKVSNIYGSGKQEA